MATKKAGNSYCATKFAEDLGITYKSAWVIIHKIRVVMGKENNKKLKGVIEADEVYCGPQLKKDNKLRFKVYSAEIQRIINGLETEEENKSRLAREAKWELKTNRKYDSPQSRLDEMINAQSNNSRSQLLSLDFREGKSKKHHYKKNTVGFLERDQVEWIEKNGKMVKVITKYGRLVVKALGRQKNDITMDKMKPILQQTISVGSILITDETNIYNSASSIVLKHFKIKHSKNRSALHKPIKYSITLEPEEDEFHIGYISTNGMENVNKHIRTMERNYLHISYGHFYRYLNEFVFAFNSRGLETYERFDNLLFHCISTVVTNKEVWNNKELYSHRPTRKVREIKDK